MSHRDSDRGAMLGVYSADAQLHIGNDHDQKTGLRRNSAVDRGALALHEQRMPKRPMHKHPLALHYARTIFCLSRGQPDSDGGMAIARALYSYRHSLCLSDTRLSL
jgi:hypothetical protein